MFAAIEDLAASVEAHMFEPLIKSVEESFEKFSLGRMVYVLFLVGVLVGGAYLFDSSTGYSNYTRLNRQIDALERLKTLEDHGVRRSPNLHGAYLAAVRDLRAQQQPSGGVRYGVDWPAVIKFLSATCIPLAFAVGAIVPLLRGKEGAGSAFGGAATVTLFLGMPTLFLPTLFGSLPLTAGLFFAAQVLFVTWFVRSYQRRQANATPN
jgi:hypothetical protein